jgi:hypothetical protein
LDRTPGALADSVVLVEVLLRGLLRHAKCTPTARAMGIR